MKGKGSSSNQSLRKQAEAQLHQEESLKKLSDAEMTKLVHELQVHQVELEIQNEQLRQTQNDLLTSRQRFSDLFHHAPIGYLVLDKTGFVKDVNETFCKMVDSLASQIINHSVFDLVAERDRSWFMARFKALYKNPEHKKMELELRTGGAARLSVSLDAVQYIVPGENSSEDAPLLLLTVNDISERKKAEEIVRLQASMLQNVPEGIFLIGVDDGLIKHANPRFENLFGFQPGEILGKNVAMLNAPTETKSPENIRDEILNVLKLDGEWHGEIKNLKKDGSVFWSYSDVSLFDHPEFGQVIISVLTDITEKKNADIALQEQTDLLATVFESSPNILMLVDAEGRVEKINRAGSEFANNSQEELIGLLGGDVFQCINSFDGKGCGRNPECADCPVRTRVTRTIQKGEPLFNEEGRLIVRKGAQNIPIDFLISTVPVSLAESDKVLVTIVDISERKQAENNLRRYLSELEALFEGAGSINHLDEPGKIGQKIVEVLVHHLSWRHVTIRLRREESDDLEVVAFGQPGVSVRDRAKVLKYFNTVIGKVGLGLSGWCVQTGECIRAASVNEYPQYIETYPGIQSGLYAPLKLGERVIGCICVESEDLDAFTEQDERLLMTLAAQAAVAFENASLYQKVQKNELQNRTILQTALDGFWVVDPKTARILDVNDAYCRMSGYSREELLQMSIADIEAVESDEDIIIHSQQVVSNGADRFESTHKRKDGNLIHVVVSVQNLQSDGFRNFAFIHDITERKRSEQSLRESEEQYRLLFDEMLSGFALHEIICDKKGKPVDYRFLTVNTAFEELTGLKADDLIGKTVLEVMPETEQFWIERYGKVALEGTADQFEGFSAAIGKYYEARAFCPEQGKFAVMFQDVTERKQAEDELRLNEENLRITLQSIGDGVIATDLEGRIVRMNSVAESLTGWEFSEAANKPLAEVFHIVNEATRKEVENPVRRVLETGKVVGLANHTTLLAHDGNEYQIADSAAPIRGKDGKIQGVILVFSDVSEKYRAEKALRENEERFSTLMQQSPYVIEIYDHNGLQIEVNKAYEKLWGFPAGTTVNSFNVLKSKEVKDTGLLEYVKRAFAGETVTVPEYVFDPAGETEARGKGRVRWLSTRIYPLRDINGNIKNIVITHDDVTARKALTDALERGEERWKRAIVASPIPIMIHNENDDVLQLSNGWTKLSGYSLIDIPTLDDWTKKAYGSSNKPSKNYIDRLFLIDKTINNGEWEVNTKDGSKRIWEFQTTPLGRMVDGNRVLLSMAVDITDRKQAEENLKRLLKEKEILLAEVHHRVKNNLQVVTSLLNLQTEGIDDEHILDILEESRARIKSMTLVHEQLYRSREYAHIDFGIYADQLVSTLFNMYEVDPGQIKFELEAEKIYLDLEKAIPCGLLLNELITNSLKYAFPKGKKGKLWVRLNPKDEKMILTVGDNGIGIPDDIDFDTTKSLGLQLINLLATHDLHGNVEMRRKKGAEFCVEFPVLPKDEE